MDFRIKLLFFIYSKLFFNINKQEVSLFLKSIYWERHDEYLDHAEVILFNDAIH